MYVIGDLSFSPGDPRTLTSPSIIYSPCEREENTVNYFHTEMQWLREREDVKAASKFQPH